MNDQRRKTVSNEVRIGLMGGTFDPPHIGHLRIAIEAVERLDLNEVRLIPVNIPSHRSKPIASPSARAEMLKRAVRDPLVVDFCEIQRGGVSFSIDTVKFMMNKIPGAKFFLIIGLDSFLSFKKWVAWEELLQLINLAVFLGLIGTFYGLLLTIGSVSNVIDGLSIEQQDFGVFFDSLRNGLKSPLSGMTIAFSSSLFGLVTSLILGLYEIISKGVKQTYFEFCESQIRLYYKASSNQRVTSSSNDNSELVSKLSELINSLDKINNNFSNSNEEIKKEISSEFKNLSKNIKDLVKK